MRLWLVTSCVLSLAGAAFAAPANEDDLIAGLKAMPKQGYVASIEKVFLAHDCSFDFSGGEAPFIRAVAREAARSLGYTAAISDAVVTVVDDLGEDAIDEMMADGRVTVNRDTRVVRMEGCQ